MKAPREFSALLALEPALAEKASEDAHSLWVIYRDFELARSIAQVKDFGDIRTACQCLGECISIRMIHKVTRLTFSHSEDCWIRCKVVVEKLPIER